MLECASGPTSVCPLMFGTFCLLLLPNKIVLLLLQAEQRYRELASMGLSVNLVLVGNKGKQYFSRRPQYNIVSEYQPVAPGCLIHGGWCRFFGEGGSCST